MYVYGVNSAIFLNNLDVFGDQLLSVLNRSLSEGEFPTCLKQSVIIPVQKVSNAKTPDKLRPINLLPTIEKVFEKVVSEQFIEYLEQNNILCEQQSGFRSGRSCETALMWMVHEWKSVIDNREKICSVFLDFQRAFETVDHDILLDNLKSYGVKYKELKWFRTYLKNRLQFTKIDSEISSPNFVELGVPQGSILGVVLFLLYINDISSVLKFCKVMLFADDTW